MIKPCPNPACNKPVAVSLAEIADVRISGGKQLVCSSCGDILWLDKDGILKSVSKEERDRKTTDN